MQKIDTLIIKALIITMDSSHRIIERGAIAVDNDSILDIGNTDEIAARYEAALTIDASNSIAMPGLINTHTHLATAMFRGLAEDMRLPAWLQEVWRYERAIVDGGTVGVSSRLAMLESILGGVTCAVDMYWFPLETAAMAQRIGFRLVNGPVFIEGADLPDGMSFPQREKYAEEFIEMAMDAPLIEAMLMPHSTYTDRPEMLSRVKRMADRYGIMVNIHASETASERDDVRSRFGKTPVRLLNDLGFLDGRALLAHCVHVDDEEIALLAGKAAVAHNPMSNLKLASGIAPLTRMADAGVRVCLGTDGAQSGNDLDMWLAMRLAAVLQKCASGDPTLFRAEDVVGMATIEAAKAIGLGNKIGSLEPGKKADIIIIDLDSPHLTPMHDPYAQLVYAVGREDVATVLIDGKLVLRDRIPITMDPRECIDSVNEISKRMRRTVPPSVNSL